MRTLKKEECDLIAYMLKDRPDYKHFVENELVKATVEEMNDGGMGSLKFLSVKDVNSIMMDEIARIDMKDIDDIPLSITLNTNKDGEIYELDIFKGDFSSLKQFPLPPYIYNSNS